MLQRFATSLRGDGRGGAPSASPWLALAAGTALLLWARRRARSATTTRAGPSMGGGGGPPPRYCGTQGGSGTSFEEAVMRGLALNGGLFVPDRVPGVSAEELREWAGVSFAELALRVMDKFVPGETCSREELRALVNKSYSAATFRSFPDVTPVVTLTKSDVHVLELFHGPTWAFKDVALQFLGNLFEHILSKRRARGRAEESSITIMGATSGDTGSAAIHGMRGKQGVHCFILFPEGRVSAIQERQMTTILDKNVQCLAIRGTFDDAQDLVKAAFKDEPFRAKHHLAAVNSINWARILAQITYYFYAYFDLKRKGQDVSRLVFVVPTGNFGDVLAGYYAKRMGLPVERFVVATNENDILHRFFTTGVYARRDVQPTITPSMDICVSSNFERFLYHMLGEKPERIQALMADFNKNKEFAISQGELQKCREAMWSTRATEADVEATIRRVYEQDKYLLDPHTAVGVCGALQLKEQGLLSPKHRVVCLATAHWAKFTPAVSKALGPDVGPKAVTTNYPAVLKALESMPVKKMVIDAELGKIQRAMEEVLRATG